MRIRIADKNTDFMSAQIFQYVPKYKAYINDKYMIHETDIIHVTDGLYAIINDSFDNHKYDDLTINSEVTI